MKILNFLAMFNRIRLGKKVIETSLKMCKIVFTVGNGNGIIPERVDISTPCFYKERGQRP